MPRKNLRITRSARNSTASNGSNFGRKVLRLSKRPTAEITAHLRAKTSTERREIMREAKRLLTDPEYVENDRLRIYLVGLLLIDPNTSIDYIEELLFHRAVALIKVHSTLFSLLGWDDARPKSQRLVRRFLLIAERYLKRATLTNAEAATMAGDFLARWKSSHGLKALVRIALQARHPAARKGALHGLDDASSWVNARNRSLLVKTVQKVADADPDSSVRAFAKLVYKDAAVRRIGIR